MLSYLGGNGSDAATSIALDSTGAIYLAGWTLSTNFPVVNGYQATNAGNYSAFITKILQAAPGNPQPVSVTPSSGSGATQSFAFVLSDPGGYTAIRSTQLLISNGFATANSCYLFYNRATNALYLTNDAATAWQAPATLGQSGTLQNTQCSIDALSSSASGSGTNLTLNLNLTFSGSFAGSKNVYMEAYDGVGDSGWVQRGTWTVPAGSLQAVSVNPSSGSGSTQVFTLTYVDPRGYTAIASSQTLIANGFVTSGSCYLFFNRFANSVYLTNDAGTAWQSPVTLGQSGTLQNSQCAVNPAASSVTGSGSTLTLNLSLTFNASFAGSKNVYMEVYDGASDSGWVQNGAWTVPGASGPPSAVSVSPSSGSGASQLFTFVSSDPSGYTAITTQQFLFTGTTFSFSSACYVFLNRATGLLYLTNDGGTAWQNPVSFSQGGVVQNSQCSLNASASSMSGSGSTLTVNISLTFFQPAFSGAKNVFMLVSDNSQNTGWVQRGTWTIP
jgi:hypothetical protein